VNDQMPDYGTPPEPEPKYGRRTPPPLTTSGDHWDHVHKVTPEQIRRLRAALHDAEPRREPVGIVLAIALLLFGSGLTYLALLGGWWALMWVVAAPFLLFGVVGLVIDGRKVPRDEKGRPLP
jgi:hypothetical protein